MMIFSALLCMSRYRLQFSDLSIWGELGARVAQAAVVGYRAMRGEWGLLARLGVKTIKSLGSDAKGMICTKSSVMMFTRVCIISTMNDAEDYAGLDNTGVVVSVQLSSVQWLEKNMARGPRVCVMPGSLSTTLHHHNSNIVYNRRNKTGWKSQNIHNG